MKQIAILSGKGGTGKTSLVASLARLAAPLVTADCDVDAANLALLLPGSDGPTTDFYSGKKAIVDTDGCSGCAVCMAACRYGAMQLGQDRVLHIDPLLCEGCNACTVVCPLDVIELKDKKAGTWQLRETQWGPLVHAALGIAEDNSGKLVAEVRTQARNVAEAQGLDLVLIDGPPGIGCPVHSTLTGVDFFIAVTEPTPSGEHDLERLLQLAKQFKIRAAVLLNKSTLSDSYADVVEATAQRYGATPLGRLPFDPELPKLLAQGRSPLESPVMREALAAVWERVKLMLYSSGQPELRISRP